MLFDGKDLSKWRKAMARTRLEGRERHIEVAPKTGDIFTREEFGPDVQLHIEFARRRGG